MSNEPISRRNVLTAALSTTGMVALGTIGAAALAADAPEGKNMMPEIYELRAIHLRRGTMQKRLDDYLKDAFIPAARRAGCGPIGAFNVVIGPGNPSTYVLIPHPAIESFLSLQTRLADDAEYKKAGEAFVTLPATDAPYASQDIALLQAFAGVPRLELPKKEPRIFELRTYRSHSRAAGRKKMEMFDKAGEIAIFRKNGLTPVFFAQTLTGSGLPSLTYMHTG